MKVKELLDIIEKIGPLREGINYYRNLADSVYGMEERREYKEKVQELQKELNDLLSIEI